MGTSKSGSGPPPGVPFVPPWVPDPTPADGDDGDHNDDQNHDAPPTPEQHPVPIAPGARFGQARRSLGRFANNGSSDDMHRGLGHYVHNGLGGASMATHRMGGTIRTAGALFGALSSAATGQAVTRGSMFDPALLVGHPVDEVMDALVEAVRPVDGTQDAEASRKAIRTAMSELLNRFPEADLLHLSEDQLNFAIENFVALDVYHRFALDLGKTVQDKAPNTRSALSRLRDIKDYIKAAVSARFRALKRAGEQLNARRVLDIVRQALRGTFEVFEEYV